MNDTVSESGWQSPEQFWVGVMQGPVLACLLEVGPEVVADEAAAGLPDPRRAAEAFKLVAERSYDRAVEADQRFGDAVSGTVVAEGVRVPVQ
ncbi:hypothetical protein [Streptomyces hydrogenans]|uniref:hypothetical protein n=1 Tax=Streptomyces hydrogenans TaxID=1873719 RepID=UPI00332C154B